jgi:hypothetical protein
MCNAMFVWTVQGIDFAVKVGQPLLRLQQQCWQARPEAAGEETKHWECISDGGGRAPGLEEGLTG